MGIIGITLSFELATLGLFLLFILSCISIFFAVHSFLANKTHKHKIAFVCGSLALSTLAAVSGWRMALQLFAVPSIASTTPAANSVVSAHQLTVAYVFSAPVDFSTMAINTYPAIELEITPHGYLGNAVSTGRELKLTSKTTLVPGERYMVYLSNIEGPLTRGYGGEHLLEINTSPLEVVEVVPGDTVTTIEPDQTFTVKLNEPSAAQDEWSVRSVPAHVFTVRQTDGQTLAVTPQTPLKQATQYTMTIIHTPTIHRLANGSEVQKFTPSVKSVLHFTTVRPPLIESVEPQGSGINPVSPVRIVFDAPMDQQSVTDRIHIIPPVSLTPQWDRDGKTLVFAHAAFPQDTDFVLRLEKGMQTMAGGSTESDLTYQFHTAGQVGIAQTDPVNGAVNVSRTQPVTITFDQQVPSNIADFVEILPAITATASAQGRVLTIFPGTPLKYETRYSVTLKTGAPGIFGLPSSKDQTFSFTTAPPTLAVPYYRQQSAFTCNIAAARMLLAFRGVNVTEKNIIDAVGIGGKRGSGNPYKGYVDDYGTYWDAVSRGVATYRPVRLITGGKLSDIIAEVKNGNPVMTWGQNGWSNPHDLSWTATDGTFIKAVNGMHSAVVYGYTGPADTPEKILINDPWRGQYPIETKEFMRRWGYFGVAMVVD